MKPASLEARLGALRRYLRSPEGQHRSEWAIISWAPIGRPRVNVDAVEFVCGDPTILVAILQSASRITDGLDFLDPYLD